MVHKEVDPRDPELRIQRLLDPGTDSLLVERTDCGMVAATGAIKGNRVVVFASDATIKSGALGVAGSQVIVAAYKEAMAKQLPIIGIWHSGGARLSDGVSSLNAFGEVFQAMILASGRIPQLSLVLGPTAGGGAYGPALTDIVVLAPEGRIFVTGPDVVKSVTGEDVDKASQVRTKRAAFSPAAESKTPPMCAGLLAITPTVRPPKRPSTVVIFSAHTGSSSSFSPSVSKIASISGCTS